MSRKSEKDCDILTEARAHGSRPMWMGEEALGGLLSYWDTRKFKEKSSKKNNRCSTRGGALYLSGLQSHLDIIKFFL